MRRAPRRRPPQWLPRHPAPPRPRRGVTLIFDRPFLYGIVDLQNGVPLFLGTFEGL